MKYRMGVSPSRNWGTTSSAVIGVMRQTPLIDVPSRQFVDEASIRNGRFVSIRVFMV
ncbi:hypothetical protein [Rubinisphaera italica]|uniref:hypothetical protein n=1 Tax=Rubinisphaera italica TaxID=2527969 RepID=UPI0013EEFBDD|nr:hypothetical protein [Rubinisphaera italica]